MKNQTKATKAMATYDALYNNALVIEGMCNRVGDDGNIIELSGQEADSQIASVLDNINSVLTANKNAGAGTYDAANAIYVVNADSYTSNYATTPVEIARLDLSYFLSANAVKWDDIKGGGQKDVDFLTNLVAFKVQLSQFRDSVSSFIL